MQEPAAPVARLFPDPDPDPICKRLQESFERVEFKANQGSRVRRLGSSHVTLVETDSRAVCIMADL